MQKKGDEMAVLSKEFADDPCSKPKRQQMILAARALLTAVTHLLILADLVDVQLILKSIRLVRSTSDLFFFVDSCVFRLKMIYNIFMMHQIKKN
jgi:hypothetical protein